jgi:hypothetical protein
MSAPTGSYRANAAIFWLSKLGPAGKAVLLALAEHCDADGRARPSKARLARMTGQSERNVKRYLGQAKKEQEIDVLEDGGGRHRPTVYRISLIDKYEQALQARKAWRRLEQYSDNLSGLSDDVEVRNGDNLSPYCDDAENGNGDRFDIDDAETGTDSTRNGDNLSPQPSLNHPYKENHPRKREHDADASSPPDFPSIVFSLGVPESGGDAAYQPEAKATLEPEIMSEDEAQPDSEAVPEPTAKEPEPVKVVTPFRRRRSKRRREPRPRLITELEPAELTLTPELADIARDATPEGVDFDSINLPAEFDHFLNQYRRPDLTDTLTERQIPFAWKGWAGRWDKFPPSLKAEYRQGSTDAQTRAARSFGVLNSIAANDQGVR